jgi:hypothetical protein
MFNDNVFVQLGIDLRYKSSYYADAYNPSHQQFYIQNTFDIYAYPVADIFLDFRINRTRVLFKYNHLNAGMMQEAGYFVTPDYTGYKSFLDLGITWYCLIRGRLETLDTSFKTVKMAGSCKSYIKNRKS